MTARITLTLADVSDRIHARTGRRVKTATLTTYQTRNGRSPVFPRADTHIGRTPLWYPATVDAWLATLPGRGVGGGRPAKAA